MMRPWTNVLEEQRPIHYSNGLVIEVAESRRGVRALIEDSAVVSSLLGLFLGLAKDLI